MLISRQTLDNPASLLVYFNSSDALASPLNQVTKASVNQSGVFARFDHDFAVQRAGLETRARRRVGREDAEDIVSQCYLEARKSLTGREGVRNLPSWLISILDNLIRLHFRRERIRSEEAYPEDDCSDDLLNARIRPNAFWDAQQLSSILAAVDLTARQYECLQRTLDGETQQEIAADLRISQRMVSYHLQAALTHLCERQDEDAFLHPFDFFCECAQHAVYRKPHVFDNQSTSVERERRRYECLREKARHEPNE